MLPSPLREHHYDNFVESQVAGKKESVKLVWLKVFRYTTHTKGQKTFVILHTELKKGNKYFSHVDSSVENMLLARFPTNILMT